MLWLLILAFVAGYYWGRGDGLRDAEQYTECWYKDSCRWMKRALKARRR